MKIAIGCDHVGFALKGRVIEHLREKGYEVEDFGTNSTERTDYPIFGKAVAKAVVSGACDKGIVICGTGVGISLAANKVKGIRAVVCSEPYSALLSRQHNDTNVLAFGARVGRRRFGTDDCGTPGFRVFMKAAVTQDVCRCSQTLKTNSNFYKIIKKQPHSEKSCAAELLNFQK